MCLAIPGKIVVIPINWMRRFVLVGGISKQVNLCMVPEAKVGDYVLVHVGVAIGVVDEQEATKTFDYLKQMGEVEEMNTEVKSGRGPAGTRT